MAIVTEFVDRGSLFAYLHSDEKIRENIRDKIIIGIARGMNHLHMESVIHRDLAAR